MKASPLTWSAALTSQAVRVLVEEPVAEPHALLAPPFSASLSVKKTPGSSRILPAKESLSVSKRKNVLCHVLAPGPQPPTDVSPGDENESSESVEDASSHCSLIAAFSPYVHEFELSDDDSVRVDQLNQLQHINAYNNSPIEMKGVERLILDIAEGEAWGCVGRRLVASQPSDPNARSEMQSLKCRWTL